MTRPMITVEGLGKDYRLGLKAERYPTLRQAMVKAITAPIRRFRALSTTGGGREQFWALRDVSFEVARGEIVGVIGRNGAGKSTLLKILSRITEPTEGCIRLRGRVASLLEVGTGFHPELTGRENIYLNGSILGMSRAEIDRKFDQIVAFSEIEQFLDTPVKCYSSGMYVRLAFAVAAHLDPEILIVDEVLAVGDTAFQKKCLGKMNDVTREGRTVLFVSHNMAIVRSLCHSTCVLDKGRLIFRGGVDEGIDHYARSTLDENDVSRVEFPRPAAPDGPYIREAWLTSDGAETGQILMGAPLCVSMAYESPFPILQPTAALHISRDDGQRLISADNRYQTVPDAGELSTSGVIHCDLGVVPFMAGRYTVTLRVGNPNLVTHKIDDALTFSIIEHDAWGTGRLPNRRDSPLWWPTRFEVVADTPARA